MTRSAIFHHHRNNIWVKLIRSEKCRSIVRGFSDHDRSAPWCILVVSRHSTYSVSARRDFFCSFCSIQFVSVVILISMCYCLLYCKVTSVFVYLRVDEHVVRCYNCDVFVWKRSLSYSDEFRKALDDKSIDIRISNYSLFISKYLLWQLEILHHRIIVWKHWPDYVHPNL